MNQMQHPTDQALRHPRLFALPAFRCALFGTIPVTAMFPLGWFFDFPYLGVIGMMFVWPLSLLLLLLSCWVLNSDWRLGAVGFLAVALMFFVAWATPAWATPAWAA